MTDNNSPEFSIVKPRREILSFCDDRDELWSSSSGWTILCPERFFPIALPSFAGPDAEQIIATNAFTRDFFRTPELCISKYYEAVVLPHQFIATGPRVLSGDSLEEPVSKDDGVWFNEGQSFFSNGQSVAYPRLHTHQWHRGRNSVDTREADNFPLVRVEDTVFSILSWYPSNVSHWLVDLFPRLWALPFIRPRVSKIMVPETSMPFVQESLRLFGFEGENIIWISNKRRYQVKSLYVPSRVGSHYNYMTPEIVQFYDQISARVPNFRPRNNPFVYVSRQDSSKRTCINELQLEEKLVKLGFLSIRISDLSFEERISVFSSARVLVGACGAGLAHSLLMPNRSCLFITGTPQMHKQSTLFLNIASQKGQQVILFAGVPVEEGKATEVDWQIDVDAAIKSIERVMALHDREKLFKTPHESKNDPVI